eukprot:TRINITY_DN4867_c0_g2_i1.p1 TRINITY_DN4867_c0_g2~~TRINITY_DN4867_c0_g2_i1.p1  ORF type:complete len:416 (+),score=33.87 TRINITY_DN4867_c0_g2_i1:67-1314(+)
MAHSLANCICILSCLFVSVSIRRSRETETRLENAHDAKLNIMNYTKAPNLTVNNETFREVKTSLMHEVSVSEPTQSTKKDTAKRPAESDFLKRTKVLFVGLFIICCCATPLFHAGPEFKITRAIMFQSGAMCLWLVGAVYFFTNVVLFNSSHFGSEQRNLTMIESIYLLAQILTTVGYGDITPAYPRGKLIVGIASTLSVLLMADIIFTALQLASSRAKSYVPMLAVVHGSQKSTLKRPVPRLHFGRFIFSVLMAMCCLSAGVAFCVLSVHEPMEVFDGTYWSLITLSSIGFGDFTPVSEDGMLFCAFWMLIGSAAMVNMGTNFFELMCQWREICAYSRLQAQSTFNAKLKKHADANGTVDRVGLLRCSLEQLGIASEEHLSAIIGEFESLSFNAEGRVAVADATGMIGEEDEED